MIQYTKSDTEAATNLQKAWADTQTVFENFGRSIVRFLDGPGTKFLEWAQNVARKTQEVFDDKKGTTFWGRVGEKLLPQKGQGFLSYMFGIPQEWVDKAFGGAAQAAPIEHYPRTFSRVSPNAQGAAGDTPMYWSDYAGPGGRGVKNYMDRKFEAFPPPGAGDKQSAINTTINVASLVVHSQASDAVGIAGDIRMSLEDEAEQANVGLG